MGAWIHYYDDVTGEQYQLFIELAKKWDIDTETWIPCEDDPHEFVDDEDEE